MSVTYLDFEAKYFPVEWYNKKYLAEQKLELIEDKFEKYMRIYLPASMRLEDKLQIIEDWVFQQGCIWSWLKYGQQYHSLLPSSYYEKMEKQVGYLQQKEETLLRNALRHDLQARIRKSKQFNISGYLFFAAESWKQLMQSFIYEIYLQIEDEIEQEEFVALLQYFVRTQPAILDKVYLILDSDGNFQLKDEIGHNLREEYLEQISEEELGDIGEVDLLLSILVTLLPQKIYLQTEGEGNLPQLRLLQQVFGDKIIPWDTTLSF